MNKKKSQKEPIYLRNEMYLFCQLNYCSCFKLIQKFSLVCSKSMF